MISFEVNDMSCNHCVGAITRAVRAVDAQAKLRFDLGQHRVDIQPASAGPGELSQAISEAGYTPVMLPAPAA